MKKISLLNIEKACISGFILAVLLSSLCFFSNCYAINKNVIRMHIIANSDTEFDQNVKLCVRDEVAKETESLLFGVSDKEEAMEILKDNTQLLRAAAEKAINDAGSENEVEVEIESGYFPTRQYENGTLPAGIYDSLKVKIGQAEGKNWWCVVFPSLCISATVSDSCESLSENETEIIKNGNTKYKIGFKIVEIFEEVR